MYCDIIYNDAISLIPILCICTFLMHVIITLLVFFSAFVPTAEDVHRTSRSPQMLLNRHAELYPTSEVTTPTVNASQSTTLAPASTHKLTSSTLTPSAYGNQRQLPPATHRSNFVLSHAVSDVIAQTATNSEMTSAMTSDMTSHMTSASSLDDESRRQRRRGKCHRLIDGQEGHNQNVDNRAIMAENSATTGDRRTRREVHQLPVAESTSSGIFSLDGSRLSEAGINRQSSSVSSATNSGVAGAASSSAAALVGGQDTRRGQTYDIGNDNTSTETTHSVVNSGSQLLKSTSAAVSSDSMSMPATAYKHKYVEPSSVMTSSAAAAATSPTVTRQALRTTISADGRMIALTSQAKGVMQSVRHVHMNDTM